jgi:hypothetical protein
VNGTAFPARCALRADWARRIGHLGHRSATTKINTHRQDPHDHENLLVGDGLDLCAARDSNPNPLVKSHLLERASGDE